MKVLVTGAGGFVGAAVVRRLLARGDEVIACVRPGSNLWRLAGSEAATVVRCDLSEVARVVGARQPEGIIHTGWDGVRGAARNDMVQVANVCATALLARTAASTGVARFVGVGSQAETGHAPRDGGGHATLYGAAKDAARILTQAIARQGGLSCAWARLFSVYGPGEKSDALIPRLLQAFKANEGFALDVDGHNAWNYLYEDDAAEGLVRLLHAPGATGTFDLAAPASRLLCDYVLTARDVLRSRSVVTFGAGKGASLHADSTPLFAALGWTPAVAFSDGIQRTAEAT